MAHATKTAANGRGSRGKVQTARSESTHNQARLKSNPARQDCLNKQPATGKPGKRSEPVLKGKSDSPHLQPASPAISSYSDCDIKLLYDAAIANDHQAQYELAKRFARGTQGASRSGAQSRYWLSRAAAGQHEEAVDKILARSDEKPVIGKEKKRLLLDTQACADHAAVKVGKTTCALEIFDKSIRLESLGDFDKATLIERLFAIPENRPYLEMAACMMKNGQITDILIRKHVEADGNQTGSFNAWRGRITVRTASPVDIEQVAETFMHELTHAVMFELHRNDVKSYSSARQKRDLKQALLASRRGEIRAITPLERDIARYMNSPFRDTGYDNRKSYKIEREVRIGAWLAADDRAREVFKKDYPLEWKRFLRQADRCCDYVAQCAAKGLGIDPTPTSTTQARTLPIREPNASHLAAAVLDRAAGEAFGDIRWPPDRKLLRARAELEEAMRSAMPSNMHLTLEEMNKLCDELAAFYRPCFSGTRARRSWDFSGIDEKSLDRALRQALSRHAATPTIRVADDAGHDQTSEELVSSSQTQSEWTSDSSSIASEPAPPRAKRKGRVMARTILDGEESSD